MKKKVLIPVVLIAFMLIGLLTAYYCTKSNGNGAEGESFLGFVSKLGNSIAGKAFFMAPIDVPKKNASYNTSYKNNAISSNSPKSKTVVVLGVGSTMKEAKKDALNNAYKRSGSYFTSNASYNNSNEVDEMGESYTEVTDVFVENSEVVSAKLIDGVVNVKLKVTVTNVPSARKGRIQ